MRDNLFDILALANIKKSCSWRFFDNVEINKAGFSYDSASMIGVERVIEEKYYFSVKQMVGAGITFENKID